MRKPTIHLNGSSRDHLREDLDVAHTKLAEAVLAVSKTSPNARDYYPQGEGAIYEAQAQHRERLAALVHVQKEVYELLEHVMDAP